MYCYPQALLTAEQACRQHCFVFEKQHAFLQQGPLSQTHYFCVYSMSIHTFENAK